MGIIKGNFSADGDSVEVKGIGFDFFIGDDTGNSFGGGTVTIYGRQSDTSGWTSLKTLTEEGGHSESSNGVTSYKINLSGSTSPDINYTMNALREV